MAAELRDYLLPFLDVDDPIVIRMRHEPDPASARLLVALGAGWIIDVAAPRCVRRCEQPECHPVSAAAKLEQLIVVEIIDGQADTSHVHLAAPRQDMHLSIVQTICGTFGSVYAKTGSFANSPWCDQCTADGIPAPTLVESVIADVDDYPTERSTPVAIATAFTCKIDGCTNTAQDMNGPYAKLCSTHKTAARAARATGGGTVASGSISDGYVARVRSLLPSARSLDQAKRKLGAGDTQERLKAEFDEASNRARAVASEENLQRLEKATKALRRGAPSREKAQRVYNDAERSFKLALGAIARDFRAP